MEFRKLIGFGKGSFIVSIPKKWVFENNLKKGDTVSIDENSNELVISTKFNDEKKEQKTITIDAKNKDSDILKSEIISSYLNTYDTIEILKDSNTNGQSIKEILRNLTGMEIIEQTSTRIVAKDLINVREVSVQNIVKRMDMTIRGMIDDSIKCIDEPDNYWSINERDSDVNRLYYLACRSVKAAMKNPHIMKAYNMDAWSLYNILYVVGRLEKIADRQKRIARNLAAIKLNKNALNELKGLYSEINNAYLETMKIFYTNNKENAHKIHISTKNLIVSCNQFLEKYSHYCSFKQKADVKEMHCVSNSNITENLKATATSIKYIARSVLDRE